MRIRYSNALLWSGLDNEPRLSDFDVLDGVIAQSDSSLPVSKLIDLGGKFVMPAFRDGHCHPLFAGREHFGPNVTEAKSLVEIQRIVNDYAASHPDVFWIDGAAYDRSIDATFHRSELDMVVSDRPVVLHGADHHTLWVNTKALEIAGLMNSIPNLSVGSVDFDDQGSPTGILREWEAMQLVMSLIPPLTIDQELDALDWAQNRLLEDGVVEVQEAWIDPGMPEIFIKAAKSERLRVKMNLAFRADPISWERDFLYFNECKSQIIALDHPLLSVNAMKFFIDGVLGSSTAKVLEPYVAGPASHSHGEFVWQPDQLLQAAANADKHGFQLHLHAIGDGAVRAALDLIEQVQPRNRAVIAHTELVSDDDVERFAKLNVVANFEPLWAREDGQLLSCLPQVGRDRIDRMYRMRDLVENGAHLSFGSDWPVSDPNPLLGVATAVNRSLPDGMSWTIEQALTCREALNAYTHGSASQITAGDERGTLALGQPAEFVVLSANPFVLNDRELFDLRVLAVSTPRSPITSSTI